MAGACMLLRDQKCYFLFSSPDFTRPSSPDRWMSDSEVEVKQSKENLKWENEVTWPWGKLPKVK